MEGTQPYIMPKAPKLRASTPEPDIVIEPLDLSADGDEESGDITQTVISTGYFVSQLEPATKSIRCAG